ncbi:MULTISPECIES: ABC transporter permease [Paracoccus]|uniref:ABC-type spermidine/putrescine transport system permease subunit I n=1 Tax=Paracoccus versutus TaxID=34007 RepID=A0A3E0BXZ6_PARVE|nr:MULTISPECIES: ABC transporter permease [Paracoccus]SFY39974.1 spermidine/putrescine transport system permease protein [Paracoccus pantotrophus]KGJ11127.1 spermidine/putrescine ABC transporter permease [Paracoccus versutus]MCJ1903071.1 ABC transporter permease [Paracoccus versutus]MDF3907553.1 ABC transporter permease [Paracoccus sp. AS002]REF73207.1 ABC-type spermidine/putrescine transport system permease subunit I [Paracoccus versutus]
MRRPVSLYGLTFSLPLLIWQLLFFVFPLVFLVALSFWTVRNFRLEAGFDTVNWVTMFGRPVFWQAYATTLAMAAGAAALTSALAFPCAYAIAFKLSPAARRWAVFLMVIPFFTSYLVRVYSWQVFLSDVGIINVMLGWIGLGPFRLLNTIGATMLGYMTLGFPLVVLLQLFSLVFVDRTLIEAAHNMRCGRLRTVFAVVIPSARVGLVIAALFSFILCFGDFVSPIYLGGGDPTTLSILITDTTKSGQQWPRAAVIALTMIATLMVVAFLAVRFAYKGRTK